MQTVGYLIMFQVKLQIKVNYLFKHLEALQARFSLDVRPNHEVLSIDRKAKTVTVRHEGNTVTESYDHLILSPGAKPFVPPIDGLSEATNAFSLRNVPDLNQIMRRR